MGEKFRKNAKKSKKGIKTVFTFSKKSGKIISYVLNKKQCRAKNTAVRRKKHGKKKNFHGR